MKQKVFNRSVIALACAISTFTGNVYATVDFSQDYSITSSVKEEIPTIFINSNQVNYQVGDTLSISLSSYADNPTKPYDVYFKYEGPGFIKFHTQQGLQKNPLPMFKDISINDMPYTQWLNIDITPEIPLGEYTASIYLVDNSAMKIISSSRVNFNIIHGISDQSKSQFYINNNETHNNITTKAATSNRMDSECTITSLQKNIKNKNFKGLKWDTLALQMGSLFSKKFFKLTSQFGDGTAWNLLSDATELCKTIDLIDNNAEFHKPTRNLITTDFNINNEERMQLFAIDLTFNFLKLDKRLKVYNNLVDKLKSGIGEYYKSLTKSRIPIDNLGLTESNDYSYYAENQNITINQVELGLFQKIGTDFFGYNKSKSPPASFYVELTPIFTYYGQIDDYTIPIYNLKKNWTDLETIRYDDDYYNNYETNQDKGISTSIKEVEKKMVTASTGVKSERFSLKAGVYLVKMTNISNGNEVFRDTIHVFKSDQSHEINILR